MHGDVVFVNQDLSTTFVDGQDGERGKWWQHFKFSGMPGSGEEKGQLKKKRTRTLYKVRNSKPGDKFEIDSEVNMSVVDLRSDSSH